MTEMQQLELPLDELYAKNMMTVKLELTEEQLKWVVECAAERGIEPEDLIRDAVMNDLYR